MRSSSDDGVGRLLGALVLLRGRGWREQLRERTTKRRTIRIRHAEQLADDGERQRKRIGRNEIDDVVGRVRGDAVEQVVDDRLHARPQPSIRRTENADATKPPEPSVIGRIDDEHVTRERRPGETLRDHVTVGRERGLHVFRQPRVAERGARFGVTER